MNPSDPVDKPISNFTIRNVLETLRELSPSNYQALLKDARLDHLQTAVLSDLAPGTVTTSQLARLYGTVYQLMGETLTRVFLANYGRKMGPLLIKHPDVQALIAKSSSIPTGERLVWAVRESQKFLSSVWATVSMREDAEAYYLEAEACPICAEIRDTRAPICASSEAVYTTLVRTLSGQRLALVEVACRARGARSCSYRLTK